MEVGRTIPTISGVDHDIVRIDCWQHSSLNTFWLQNHTNFANLKVYL